MALSQPECDSVSTLKLRTLYMYVYVCPYLTRAESNGRNSESSSKLTLVLASFHKPVLFFSASFFFTLRMFCSSDGATLSLHHLSKLVLIALKRMKHAKTLRDAIFPMRAERCV